MTGRVFEQDLREGTRPGGGVFEHQLKGLSSGAKGRTLEQQMTTAAGSAPGTPIRGRVFEHHLAGDSPNLLAVLSVSPSGRSLEPQEPFTITAVNSSGTPIGWTFSFAPGSPTTILTGSGGTRTGTAPVVEPSPVLDGAGIWHGVDNQIYMTVEVEVTDGIDTDTGSIQIPIAPHLVWTRIQPSGVAVPVLKRF